MTPRRFALIARERVAALDADRTAADRRAALLAAILANQKRPESRRPYRVEDFMPKRAAQVEAPRRQQTVAEMQLAMSMWAAVTAPAR